MQLKRGTIFLDILLVDSSSSKEEDTCVSFIASNFTSDASNRMVSFSNNTLIVAGSYKENNIKYVLSVVHVSTLIKIKMVLFHVFLIGS